MQSIYHDQTAREERLVLDLDEIARRGARKLLAQALEAEVEAYLEAANGARDEHGRALVVRNGRAESRQVLCGAGTIEVRAPRVNDRRVDEQSGQRMRFRSVILPPYMRRSPKVTEVLPLLYLHGLSSGDFARRPCGSSSAPRPGYPRPPSSALPSGGEKSVRSSRGGTSRRRTTSTCGWTGYTRR